MPCQMMQPFLDELIIEYKGQAMIAFVDVWKHSDYGQKFEIFTIPTQIFFDHKGQETFRHQGYLDKNSIVQILEELLQKQNSGAESLGSSRKS
jgi:thioredoxin 1